LVEAHHRFDVAGDVLAEAQRRLDVAGGMLSHLPKSDVKNGQFWVSYDVTAGGEAMFHNSKVYIVGHSMKCKWTSFINDLAAFADAGKWRIVEETDTRKVVVYADQEIGMTVFQLVTITVPPCFAVEAAAVSVHPPGAGVYDPYKPVGVCIQDGTHLTDCDEDGYCNYCGEQ
jgi:hypothetical protein